MTGLPWVYPYQEDGPRLNSVLLRPVVPVSIVGAEASTPVFALLDSGCEHMIAAPYLADEAGIDPRDSHRELMVGLGGETVELRFMDVRMRLHAPDVADDEAFIEWEDEVGFLRHWRSTWPMIVGQSSFMKQFTVTLSRFAQATAIETADTFDWRFSGGHGQG